MITASPASLSCAVTTSVRARHRRCCCRMPRYDASGSSSDDDVPSMISRPLGSSEVNDDGGRRSASHSGPSAGWSNSYRRNGAAGVPGPGGRTSDVELDRGDPRPTVDPLDRREERLATEHVESGGDAAGRTPSSTIHEVPSGASTRSACPVFWIGRSVLRWLRIGLAGQLSHGPIGAGPRAIDTACPRSVPPSAISRYQTPSRSYRCGASG